MDVAVLRSLTGMWIWGALTSREALSILHTVFKFIDRFFPGGLPVPSLGKYPRVKWWPSARREVLAMAHLLPLLVGDLGSPLLDLMCASDASGAGVDNGGFGVVVAKTGAKTMREVWRKCAATSYAMTRGDETGSRYQKVSRRLSPSIPVSRLPASVFELEWVPLKWGRWKWKDHITLGEARAHNALLQSLAKLAEAHRSKAIALQDNGAVAGGFAKGRSSRPAFNFLCRRRAALSLSSRIRTILPWTETSRMPADGLSRQLDFDL